MARRLRYVPPGGGLVEVSNRTIQGLFLLRPGSAMNEIIAGLLARGKRMYGVKICLYAFLSNHYHMALWVRDAKQLADFMRWFGSNLAREAGRLHGWKGPFWADRYHSINVSTEEESQVARLRYLLAQGAKEELVASPREWPGVHCAQTLLSDQPLEGVWYSRTKESAARMTGKDVGPRDFAEPEVLHSDPLPCWAHLPKPEYQRRLLEIVEEIEGDVAARIEATGKTPPGPRAILAQNPRDSPNRPKSSPAPLFHAYRKSVRRALWEAYAEFVAAFRQAAERLKLGDPHPAFPEGSFPPGAPFVGIPLPAT